MAQPLDDEAIHAILTRAAHLDGQSQVDRQILEKSAAELGISPEALKRAEAEVLAERALKSEEQRFQAKLQSEFRENLIPYILVNAMLIGIWFVSGSGHFWPIYPLLGWGIGVAMSFFATRVRGPEYQRKFEQWRVKEQRRQEKSLRDRLETTPVAGEEIEPVKDL